MSKRSYISRYHLIIKRLEQKPYSSFEDLNVYINRQMELYQDNDEPLTIDFSKRTFQRDIKELHDEYGFHIDYCKQRKGYFISHSANDSPHFVKMMEAFELFNALNLSNKLSGIVQFENRNPQGTENLHGLLQAIKNHLVARFCYQAFYWEHENEISIEPYLLKQFKNRWYVIGKNTFDNHVKTYALDRMKAFEITNQYFDIKNGEATAERFHHCFGITCPDGEQPQEVLLSFNPFQGNYIKSLPLHHTQKIMIDNEEELQIKLSLLITHDFVMELLSFGEKVMVLKPDFLVNQLRESYQNALKHY